MTTAGIIAAIIVSTIGLSFFVFGKKQQRLPQLIVGILMMALPMLVQDAMWIWLSTGLLLIGMRVAILYEQ